MITVLTGGGGGAKFLQGLASCLPDPGEITAIVNTGDDFVIHGLKVSPDLDSVIYYLSDRINTITGWGLADESFATMAALAILKGETWFSLGDRDLATHLYRTQRLNEGVNLCQITKEITKNLEIALKVLPMTDDIVSTRIRVDLGSFNHRGLTDDEIGFQEYFVKYACLPKVSSIRFSGSENAKPTEGVLEAISKSKLVILGPSNPFLSIDPILSVPLIKDTVMANKSKVLAISPIVGGKAIKGPLSKLLTELGKNSDVVSVAAYLNELASNIVIDQVDEHLKDDVEKLGYEVDVTNTLMKNKSAAIGLANFIIDKFYV